MSRSPLSGNWLVRAAAVTPGTCRTASSACAKKRYVVLSFPKRRPEVCTCIVSRPDESNPAVTEKRRSRLRNSSPELTRRTRASATSATTSALRVRRCPPAVRREPSCRSWFGSLRAACSAGINPKASPISVVTPNAKANTVPSTAMESTRGSSGGLSAMSARTPSIATTMPSTPPNAARSMLSVSSCRISRPRPAPSAVRSANSPRRWTPRARSRFVTFTQAITSTSVTAAEDGEAALA